MQMRFNITYESIAADAFPGDDNEPGTKDKVPVQVDATPAIKGDAFNKDTDVSDEKKSIDTLLDIEKAMRAPGPDEGVADGHSEQEAGIENAVAIECELNAIAEELDENSRILEIAENLTDVQTIVQATPDGQMVDIPMLQTAANMAVAGTDGDATDILPAMESFKDKQIAIEALQEKINNAVNSVMDSIKNIFARGQEVIKKIFSSVQRLEAALKQREAALAALKTPVTFKVKGSRFLQKSQQEYVKDTNDFVASLDHSVKIYAAWSKGLTTAAAKFSTTAKSRWKHFFVKSTAQPALGELYNSFVQGFGGAIKAIPTMKVTEQDADGVTWLQSDPILGGMTIEAVVPTKPADFATGDKAALKHTIMNTQAMLGKDYLFHDQKAPVIEFTVGPQDVQKIIALNTQLLKEIKLYLDKQYKDWVNFSGWMGPQGSFEFSPLVAHVMDAAINVGAIGASGSQKYGEKLLRSTFIILDKAVAAAAQPAAVAQPTATKPIVAA